MKWISSNGGPLIFSSRKAAQAWMGTMGSSLNTDETDYDRACEVSDYIEIIPSGGCELAVLGDEPMQSKLFVNENSIFIARWVYCESKEIAEIVLRQLPENAEVIAEDKYISLLDDDLIIFDSALSFDEIGAENLISLSKGVYRLTTEMLKSEKKYYFIIHRVLKHS